MDQPLRAIKSLESILDLDGRNVQAAKELIPLYEMGQKWSKLANVLEIALGDAREADERKEYLLRLSSLYETRLRNPDQAFFSYVLLFKEAFSTESELEELARLATLSDNWDTFVSVVEETVDRLQNADVRIAALLRIAGVYRTELDDSDAALGHYQTVRDAAPENLTPLNAMEGIFEERGAWNELIDVLQRKEKLVEDETERRSILFQVGESGGMNSKTTWRLQRFSRRCSKHSQVTVGSIGNSRRFMPSRATTKSFCM